MTKKQAKADKPESSTQHTDNQAVTPQGAPGRRKAQKPLFDLDQAEIIFEGRKELAHIRDNFHRDMVFALRPDKALQASIDAMGVLQPILIERKDNLQYVIRAGKRRFLAAEEAKMKDIPCIIKSFPLGMGAKAGIDTNITPTRNPVDEYNLLLEVEASFKEKDETLSDKKLAAMLGMTIPALQKMRCVETMSEEVQKGINERRITIDNAYKLAKLPPSRQDVLVNDLREGKRVTGSSIKQQKRVLLDDVKELTLPQMNIPIPNLDIPRLSVIREVIPLRFPKLTKKAQGEIADFIYSLMTNPTKTLDLVYDRLGKEKQNE